MRALVLHVTTQLGFWWQKDPLNLVVTNIEGGLFFCYSRNIKIISVRVDFIGKKALFQKFGTFLNL